MSITRRLEQRTHWEKLQTQHILSAFLRNALFILNLGCYHYVNNSKALSESIFFFSMDPIVVQDVFYIQFPQRFDGIHKE